MTSSKTTPLVATRYGLKVVAYTATWPSRRYWYRHDVILLGDRPLEGFVQTRCYRGRYEVITCHGNACVLGKNVDWLIRMNNNGDTSHGHTDRRHLHEVEDSLGT